MPNRFTARKAGKQANWEASDRRYVTPWEVFEKLKRPGQYLKQGETLKALGERHRFSAQDASGQTEVV